MRKGVQILSCTDVSDEVRPPDSFSSTHDQSCTHTQICSGMGLAHETKISLTMLLSDEVEHSNSFRTVLILFCLNHASHTQDMAVGLFGTPSVYIFIVINVDYIYICKV